MAFLANPDQGLTDLLLAGGIYAGDPGGERALVYDPSGTLKLERQMGGPGRPWRPIAVAAGPDGRVAVLDGDQPEIQLLRGERTP